MIQSTDINNLLEQYVFQVAAKFIDLARPEDQTTLINLLNSIEKSSRNTPDENSEEMSTSHQNPSYKSIFLSRAN